MCLLVLPLSHLLVAIILNSRWPRHSPLFLQLIAFSHPHPGYLLLLLYQKHLSIMVRAGRHRRLIGRDSALLGPFPAAGSGDTFCERGSFRRMVNQELLPAKLNLLVVLLPAQGEKGRKYLLELMELGRLIVGESVGSAGAAQFFVYEHRFDQI